MAEPTSYQGGSAFLRWWPAVLLGCAFVMFRLGGFRTIQWIAVLLVVAAAHARFLPWQFTIRADGLMLTFPFGRHRFLPKASFRIRMETIGATALVGRRQRIGYLLMDRVLYEPGRDALLRSAFTGLGYELT